MAVREDFTAADATVRRTVFILTDVLYNALDLMLPAIGVLIGSPPAASRCNHGPHRH